MILKATRVESTITTRWHIEDDDVAFWLDVTTHEEEELPRSVTVQRSHIIDTDAVDSPASDRTRTFTRAEFGDLPDKAHHVLVELDYLPDDGRPLLSVVRDDDEQQ